MRQAGSRYGLAALGVRPVGAGTCEIRNKGIAMQPGSVVPKARILASVLEKSFYRRLTCLAMASSCWIWTVPAVAQSSSSTELTRPAVELLLTCRGYFEAIPKTDDAKFDEIVGASHKVLVMVSDEPTFRQQIEKRISSQKERVEYMDQGRAIVHSGDQQAMKQWYDKCMGMVGDLAATFGGQAKQ